MARLFRHSPLNSVWEGSGNVIALDILRAHTHLPALLRELHHHKGKDSRLDNLLQYINQLVKLLKDEPNGAQSQRHARHVVDKLALALQAAVVMEHGDERVARAFLASRLGGEAIQGGGLGSTYGSFVHNPNDAQHILERNLPVFV